MQKHYEALQRADRSKASEAASVLGSQSWQMAMKDAALSQALSSSLQLAEHLSSQGSQRSAAAGRMGPQPFLPSALSRICKDLCSTECHANKHAPPLGHQPKARALVVIEGREGGQLLQSTQSAVSAAVSAGSVHAPRVPPGPRPPGLC